MVQLELTPRAQSMVLNTIDWYNEKRRGQGTKFYKELLNIFNTISSKPRGFQKKYKNIHMVPLKNHPYLVFYTNSQKKITILAVLHTSRDPNDWPIIP